PRPPAPGASPSGRAGSRGSTRRRSPRGSPPLPRSGRTASGCSRSDRGPRRRPPVAPRAPRRAGSASEPSGCDPCTVACSFRVEPMRPYLAPVVAEILRPRPLEGAEIGPAFDRGAHLGIAGQHVERQPVGDVLVRRLLPRELPRVGRGDLLEESEG